MKTGILEKLKAEVRGSVLAGEPLSGHTTYGTGGLAEIMVIPEDSAALQRAVILARDHDLPITMLGAGSNVIAPDEGIEGVTVCNALKPRGPVSHEDSRVKADSGVMLEDLIRFAAGEGLGGFEGVMGIPGTVGGGIVMNAGTDEGTISDYLQRIEVLGEDGIISSIEASDLGFGYRSSVFPGSGLIILSAEFSLPPADEDSILARLESVWDRRRERFPLDMPSAGSVFKRPDNDYAGRLIEEAGCKGMSVGGARVSEIHANFIVNTGKATSSDIIDLIAIVRAKVIETSGVDLDLEQVILQPK